MIRTEFLRGLAPHAVITIGACAAAWILLMSPQLDMIEQLDSVRTNKVVQLRPEQRWLLERHAAEMQAWAAELESHARLSRDSNRLFAAIMDLAETHNVHVASLQPSAVARSDASSRGQPSSRDAAAHMAQTGRLDLNATGQFKDVADFIHSLFSDAPLLRLHSLQISPADDGPPPTISVRLTCDVLDFSIPPVLVARKGGKGEH